LVGNAKVTTLTFLPIPQSSNSKCSISNFLDALINKLHKVFCVNAKMVCPYYYNQLVEVRRKPVVTEIQQKEHTVSDAFAMPYFVTLESFDDFNQQSTLLTLRTSRYKN